MESKNNQIKELVADNRLETALDLLIEFTKEEYEHLESEAIGLKNRYMQLQKENISGLLSPQENTLVRNQIISGILELLKMMGEHSIKTKSSPDKAHKESSSSPKNVINIHKNFGDLNF